MPSAQRDALNGFLVIDFITVYIRSDRVSRPICVMSPRRNAVLDQTATAGGNRGFCIPHGILRRLTVTVLLGLSQLLTAADFDYAVIERAIREHRFSWAQQR